VQPAWNLAALSPASGAASFACAWESQQSLGLTSLGCSCTPGSMAWESCSTTAQPSSREQLLQWGSITDVMYHMEDAPAAGEAQDPTPNDLQGHLLGDDASVLEAVPELPANPDFSLPRLHPEKNDSACLAEDQVKYNVSAMVDCSVLCPQPNQEAAQEHKLEVLPAVGRRLRRLCGMPSCVKRLWRDMHNAISHCTCMHPCAAD
jgi:hypothetical protein